MNATSALVLILILSFAADRIGKTILFALHQIPWWARRFPDPQLVEDKAQAAAARRRGTIAYAAIVGAIVATAAALHQELLILRMLTPDSHFVVDLIVTTTVLMGGSDLIGRIIRLSGVIEGDEGDGAGGHGGRAARRDGPIEVVGRLTLDDRDRLAGVRAGEVA